MRVLICEAQVPGHHLRYAALAARAARRVSDDVVLGLSSDAVGTFWHEHFVRPLAGQVKVLTTYPTPPLSNESGLVSMVSNRTAYWTFLRRYIRDVKPDHVIVPSADRAMNVLCLLPKALSRGPEIEVVVHQSPLARSGAMDTLGNRLRRKLFLRSPAVSRVHLIDPTQYAATRGLRGVDQKFRSLADPVEQFDPIDREEARRAMGLPSDRRIALMVSPAPFKGAISLLNLFRDGRAPADSQLVFTGTVDPSVRDYVHERLSEQVRRGQILVLEGLTQEIDLHHAICAADLVVPRLTPLHGTTAMCIRSVVAGRRFFCASSSWVDMMARELGLGESFDGRRPDGLAEAFSRALDRAREPIDAEVVRRLRRFHSADTFMNGIGDRLRVRSGLRSTAGIASWEWVLDPTKGQQVSSAPA